MPASPLNLLVYVLVVILIVVVLVWAIGHFI